MTDKTEKWLVITSQRPIHHGTNFNASVLVDVSEIHQHTRNLVTAFVSDVFAWFVHFPATSHVNFL